MYILVRKYLNKYNITYTYIILAIRSLSIEHDIITIGDSLGALLFLNYKNRWYQRESDFTRGAIFTHQWEPNGSRLFIAGGSLYQGIDDAHASIFF